MGFLLGQLLFLLFVFLFFLYSFSHDDFTLLRKNISQQRLFNTALLVLFVGLFFSRLFYVMFHFKPEYANPFVFLLFPYFPGLSLEGGVVGAGAILYFYARGHKMPTEKLEDMFLLSFFSTTGVGYSVYRIVEVVSKKSFVLIEVLIALFYLICSAFLIVFYLKGTFKDGTVGLLALSLFSLLQCVLIFVLHASNNVPFVLEEGFLMILFVASLVLVTIKEKVFIRVKRKKV